MFSNWNKKQSRKILNDIFTTWIKINLLLINTGAVCNAQESGTLELNFSVAENVSVGFTVTQLPGSSGGFFIINQDDNFDTAFDKSLLESRGEIRTISLLDHETTSTYEAIVINGIGIVYTIDISVTDVNDNRPTFPEPVVYFDISEASQIGSKFDIGSATDDDSFPLNVKGYRISDGNSEQFFRIGTRNLNGFVFADLIVNKSLNREENVFFALAIEAFDGGNPPNTGSVQLNISITDVNDNAPAFDLTRYTTTIRENAEIGTDVILLTATDLDSGENKEVSYRIDRSQSDPNSFFVINSTTGQISLNKRINFEDQMQHKIVVEAVDGGSEPLVGSTVVLVTVEDVNDNKPVLEVIFLGSNGQLVSEATPIGTYIARVSVSDPDVGQVSNINVELSGGDDRFDLIQSSNNSYLVAIKNLLDRESQSTHHFTLNATDSGSSPLSTIDSFAVTVADANDNPPKFDEDLYEIPLNQLSAGTYVTQVQAVDEDEGINAEVTYSLSATNQSDWFLINQDSGLITTRQILDPSINASPRLVVIATDGGSPSLSSNTTVVVNIVDTSGDVPQFDRSSYSASVPENISVGECFLRIQASSSGSSVLSYSITSSSSPLQPVSQFSINITTGDVCVTSSLDRETTSSYDFEVRATNQNGRYARVFLHVIVDDVNEFSPVFQPVTYIANVDRNAEVDFPITQVTATDADDVTFSQITYSVMSGNEENFFNLNPSSGQISVAQSLAGLEIGTSYQLTITATDERGMTSSQSAIVTVNIVDDNTANGGPIFDTPSYRFEIDEDAAVSTVFGRVTANSQDGRVVIYQLRHDPPNSNWFKINQSNGDLYVAAEINREFLPDVTLEVIASAGIPPAYSFATIRVILNDVNDNSPHFYASSNGVLPSITIPYSLSVGFVLGTFSATDSDAGENGTVEYFLSSSYFDIETTTGNLIVTTLLPQSESAYLLPIEARDQGTPTLTTMTSLTVHVRHPDDNCPVFTQSTFEFRILESFPSQTVFGSLSFLAASDVTLNLTGTSYLPFGIYSNGSLYLQRSIDREVQYHYQFKVTASGVPSLPEYEPFCTTSVDVIVTIDDVNDNSPDFNQSVYSFDISENLPAGIEVGSVSASDEDALSQITYEFVETTSMFEIHRRTGVISTLASLDRESVSRFDLRVRVSDGENLSEATIFINVVDINDHPPTFVLPTPQLAVVSVGSNSDMWVADIQAVDFDSGQNGNITYSINDTSLFKIDQRSGRVLTSRLLTEDNLGIHVLGVTAQDHGTPPRSTSTILRTNIVPTSANPSLFSSTQFVFAPFEDTEIGEVLGNLQSLSGSRLKRSTNPVFRFPDGSDESMFSVNEATGDIILRRRLNYETSPQYIFTINKLNQDDLTVLTAQINIRDVNRHSPTFASGTFYISVLENAAIGSEVWRFISTDEDSGLDGEVSYSLVSQEPVEAFIIDPNSGSLIVNSILDRENISEYLLVINATDRSMTSPRFSTASCVVTLLDVNDNAPQFVGRHDVYIREDEPAGSRLIRLNAFDVDERDNSHVTLTLESVRTRFGMERSNLFYLDPLTGVLILTGELDYETVDLYILNISATDESPHNPKTILQEFIVHVIDVNDAQPRFERLVYPAEVTEGQSSGVIVTRVTAVDANAGANEQFTYSLQNSSDSNYFSISPRTGIITTQTTLDRETQEFYTLVVLAEDNSLPPHYDWTTINITVLDINDNPPQFVPLDDSTDPPTLIRLSIPEQANGPLLVCVLTVGDLDQNENSRISYSITGGNSNDDFFVNASTGELWTTRQLDREQTGLYQLRVVATDHGEPPQIAVGLVDVTVLDRNDNNPLFGQNVYIANVTEEMSRGQYVTTIRASDLDEGLNGKVRYFIAPPASNPEFGGAFDIDVDTGVVTTVAVLDREKIAQYQLYVTAVDNSPANARNATVLLTVDVNDINDNSPRFDSSVVRVNISRNEQVGAVVGQVRALDVDVGSNGTVTYSVEDDTLTNPYFSVDSTSGDISVARLLNTLPSPFAFTVIAVDQGFLLRSAKAVVVVSAADATQSLPRLEFGQSTHERQLWETIQRGFQIINVTAAVIGNSDLVSDVTYDILTGNEDGNRFSISESGIVTVSEPSLIDYEKKPRISMMISVNATNSADETILYAFTTVNIQVIDDNDNAPRFSQRKYYAQIMEELPAEFVLQLSASDADSEDNGRIQYDLLTSNEVFAVDTMTGILRTTRDLDREIAGQYELIVHATDFGENRKTGTCTVNVDVLDTNDHRPTLVVTPNPILVAEDTAVGSMVARATANDLDLDQDLTFSFSQNGNPGEYFSIDRYGGGIFVTSSLDYEKLTNVTLGIETSDGLYITSSMVAIQIGDINDNRPAFNQTAYFARIDEFSPISTPVVTVKASDADSGNNGRVSYRISNSSPNQPYYFSLNAETGLISINQSVAFSPDLAIFNLEIEAYDHGSPRRHNSVSVRIEIVDINNHAPQFDQPIYELQVIESVSRDYSVINFTATDADYVTENRNIYFEIVSGNTGETFSIETILGPGNDTIGELRTFLQPDREKQAFYDLTITAFGRGQPQLSSKATVRIQILDVNDNKPRFNASRYYGSVTENNEESEPPTLVPVVSIYATDDDSSVTSNFQFSIISGNDDDSFELGTCASPSSSCALILAKVVDYETKPMHNLTVQVDDNNGPALVRPGITEVLIYVNNVNEYAPTIEAFTRVTVSEIISAGRTLFYITVTDRDAGFYGRISFSVLSENWTSVGQQCLPPQQLFVIESISGAVSSTQNLDFERCQMYNFQIEACDPDYCVTSAVQLEVLPVDEFPPQFLGTNPDLGYQFFVPYGSSPGFIVGGVSATDADSGEDGEIRYSFEESSNILQSIFLINETTGLISLATAIESSNSHILILTASTRNRKASTRVTISVTDIPPVTMEALILAVVFGVIAVIIIIVLVLICLKRRGHIFKKSEASQVIGENHLPAKSVSDTSRQEYYDLKHSHQGAHVGNGTSGNGNHKKEHVIKNGGAGDFQLKTFSAMNGASANKTMKIPVHLEEPKNPLQKKKGKYISSNNHSISTPPVDNPHSSSYGSAEDEEVQRITSTPSSIGGSSRSPPSVFSFKHRVADSGIQQDMDKASDVTDSSRLRHQSFKSMENTSNIDSYGGKGEGLFTLPGLPGPRVHDMGNGAGEGSASEVENLGGEMNPYHSRLLGYLDSRESKNLSSKTKSQEWVPDFQPLSSVFSEIARLREESLEDNSPLDNKPLPPLHVKSRSFGEGSGPPPLLTSLPQYSDKLTAPVPISLKTSNAGVHVPSHGFYPRPASQYHHGQGPVSHSSLKSYHPPPYSLAMSSRPGSGGSIHSRASRSSQHSQSRTSAPFSLPPSISGANSSVPSLPRTPLSHQSGPFSPAMSPGFSPTLVPLSTKFSFDFEPTTNRASLENASPNLVTTVRSHSKRKKEERMLHI